jgi:hypothetical protein
LRLLKQKSLLPGYSAAPFDVRLPKTGKKSAIQIKRSTPLYSPICVSSVIEFKLDERGCLGAPDLIVEILSPGNSKVEMFNKFELYQETGVREYWLVEPSQNAVLVYVLDNEGKYVGLQPAINVLKSTIFPELEIDLKQIFS